MLRFWDPGWGHAVCCLVSESAWPNFPVLQSEFWGLAVGGGNLNDRNEESWYGVKMFVHVGERWPSPSRLRSLGALEADPTTAMHPYMSVFILFSVIFFFSGAEGKPG